MRRRSTLALLAVVVAMLVATACGTTEPTDPGGREPGAAGEPITLTDGVGRQVTLPGPATRVVGLEWGALEHVVSLGVMPVGAADPAGYETWVSAAPLDPSVRDVGERGEPSIDAIAALRPDLVVATDRLDEGALSQLEAFTPVMVIPGGDAADPIGGMNRTIELLGQALGKQAEATALNDGFDATLTQARERLAARAGQRFLFVDGSETGGQVDIRPYTDASLVGAVTTRLGLVNAWTGPGDGTYGLAQTDVEGLTRVPADTTMIYVANDRFSADPFGVVLADNQVWRSLPFVAAGRVERLPDGIWFFGGPASMQDYVEALVAALEN